MSDNNKALVQRWFDEVWNSGRAEAIDEMFASEGVAHGLAAEKMHGPGGFKAFHASFRGAFPDVRVHIDDMVAEGDQVAYRFTATGTHSGGQLGFAATNRPMNIQGMGFVRIANGMIVEGWNVLDQLGMMSQLGAVTMAKS
jgi:steroid delta-isomerase-like uncharacterized protein